MKTEQQEDRTNDFIGRKSIQSSEDGSRSATGHEETQPVEIPEVLPTQQEELLQQSYVEKKIIQYVNQYGNLEEV